MDNKPLPPNQDIALTLDTSMMRDVVRRKAGLLALIGVGVGGLFMAQKLLLSPQFFTAEVSIIMQQSGSTGGGLSALFGGGATSRKYIGLLRSRTLAETVEKKVDLQSVYHTKTHEDAASIMMANIKPEDTADGLLLVSLKLPAPPTLASDPQHQREKVRLAVAKCANAYADALQEYYDKSNSERDNVLLETANVELRRALTEYRQATNRVRAFITGLDRVPAISAPSGGEGGVGGAPQNMVALFQEQDSVEADIRAAEAVEEAQRRLTAEQLQNLKTLPTEDILLNEARATQHTAERSLKRKQDLYGPDHPQVQDAKDTLRRANEELERQKQGIQELRTSDHVELTKKLEGLRARRETIVARIADMEGNLSTKRGLTSKLEFLRNEQSIAFEERKAAEVKSIDVRMSAVSGRSMISVLDSAVPPLSSTPDKKRTMIMGALLGGMAMLVTAIAEYLRLARRRAVEALHYALATQHATPETPHKNGHQTANTGPKAKK